MASLVLLILGGLGIWLWFETMRVREIAVNIAKNICERNEVQFLDDTVSLNAIGLGRDVRGQLRIRRVYQFEFSDDGTNRRKGYILMLGTQHEALRMERDEPLP